MLNYDVVVVGCGPAGSAAALRAAKAGKKVLAIERGPEPGSKNVSGAMIRKDYVSSVFGDGLPFEREVQRIKLSLYNGDSPVDIEFSPENLVTTGRLKFDKWLSSVAENAGAMVISKTTGLELKWENGTAKSLVTDRGEVTADAFVLAEGVNSLLSMKSGIKKDFTPDTAVQAVKEVYAVKKEDINSMFNLPDESKGLAWRFVMTDPLIAGFLYTYKDSVAVGIGSPIRELVSRKMRPEKVLDDFLDKTGLAKKFEGYSLREYSAKVIPEGGFPSMNPGKGNVYLCGDALGLVDPLTFDGISPAIASGALAGDAAASGLSQDIYHYNLVKDPEISKIVKERPLEGRMLGTDAASGYINMLSSALNSWASGDLLGIGKIISSNFRNVMPDLIEFMTKMR